MAKTKALISFAVTAKLICVFVFAYANTRFSYATAHITKGSNHTSRFMCPRDAEGMINCEDPGQTCLLCFCFRSWSTIFQSFSDSFLGITTNKHYFNSFLPSTIRAWNNLPQEAQQMGSVNSFKFYLKKENTPVPKYFYTGNRKVQILHTRLRTNCSSLNLDLFIKNVSDSPMCSCGSVEDTQHYFFHCVNFRQQRTELINEISRYYNPSLKLLLYGDQTLSFETNVYIFQAVHKYICNTKRF